MTGPDTHDDATVRRTPPRWPILAVLVCAQMLVVLDASLMTIALPSAQESLGMSDTSRQWVVVAFTLTFGGFLLLGGRLADLLGRKRVLLTGLVGLATAATVGGLANGEVMLVAARAAQGLSAALVAPAALSLLATTFTEPEARARAFGVFGAAVGTGAVLGMVLGGVLTEYGSWRWCLLLNLPLTVAVLVPALLLLTESRSSGVRRYDVPGAVTAALGVGSLVYGVSLAAGAGWREPAPLAFGALGLAMLGLFVLIESRTAHPLLPLRVVADRARGGAYLIVLLVGAALLGFFLVLTYYLQAVRGYSPLMTGLAFVPSGIGILFGSLGAGRIMTRVSPRTIMILGLLSGASGLAWLATLTPGSGFVTLVLPAQLAVGLGVGAALTTITKATLDGVAVEDTGVASALTNTFRQIGGAVGLSALNVVTVSATAAHGGPGSAAGLTHGYAVALLASAGLLAVALVIAVLLIRPGTRGQAD
ncbi:MFS transporter [Nocardiopsis sp. NPDC058789]|uniref:MFS transporter n=1 Tax=Nocardiopsis sp. NPDC058789 TaxID=3346634 RepID=UPI003671E68C